MRSDSRYHQRMARYIKRFGRVGLSLGPSEERKFEMWVGYDLPDYSADLSHLGLVYVDGWTEERLAETGVATFRTVTADDRELLEQLGLTRAESQEEN